jgi:hypothetical protein
VLDALKASVRQSPGALRRDISKETHMRIARKLILLAIMAMALSATTASAQVELTDEETGLHCGVASSSCLVEIGGSYWITLHLTNGVEVTAGNCSDYLVASVGEDGEGFFTVQTIIGAFCPNKPCEATSQTAGNGDPWPLHLDELDPGVFTLHAVFCYEPAAGGGAQRNCEIVLSVDDWGDHFYVFNAFDETCAGTPPPTGVRAIEMDGLWSTREPNFSGHTDVEITHG